jgi:low affinity Fe/Cu permease
MNLNKLFTEFSKHISYWARRPAAFVIALALIIVWAVSGPLFGFGDTWQLVINTSTTIITFLMVFLIQSSQNRDTAALQMKLDELIRVTEGAHNILLDLEELDEGQLQKVRKAYEEIACKARQDIRNSGDGLSKQDIDLSMLYEGGDVEVVDEKKS